MLRKGKSTGTESRWVVSRTKGEPASGNRASFRDDENILGPDSAVVALLTSVNTLKAAAIGSVRYPTEPLEQGRRGVWTCPGDGRPQG